jgi:MFS family permease
MTTLTAQPRTAGLLDRLGVPRALIWGFIGLTIFMIGDGVETNILEPFLRDDHGFSTSRVGTLVTVYGIAVAAAAFFAAALSDLWGPRRVMMLGVGVWVTLELAFLCLALTTSNPWLIFITYGLRGFGYPLFAYGFLVWITAVVPAEDRATGVGWFYVGFSAGLPTLGALTATVSLSLLNLDFYQTLWLSLSLVVIGAGIALTGIREPAGRRPLVDNPEEVSATLSRGFKLLATDKRARRVTYIRTINSVPTYAMAVYFPVVLHRRARLETRLVPHPHDRDLRGEPAVQPPLRAHRRPPRLGHHDVLGRGGRLCGHPGRGVLHPADRALPECLPDPVVYGVTLFFGALFGVSLAGYVPLSAIAVAVDPEHPGAAMSTYNLGVGAAVAVGPLLVAVFLPLRRRDRADR